MNTKKPVWLATTLVVVASIVVVSSLAALSPPSSPLLLQQQMAYAQEEQCLLTDTKEGAGFSCSTFVTKEQCKDIAHEAEDTKCTSREKAEKELAKFVDKNSR